MMGESYLGNINFAKRSLSKKIEALKRIQELHHLGRFCGGSLLNGAVVAHEDIHHDQKSNRKVTY